MTDQSLSYNLRTLRDLLIEAFDTDELRALAKYDPNLGKLDRKFAPADDLEVRVDKTIDWCARRDLIPYLVQLVKEERPEKYNQFAAGLFTSATIISARFNLPADLPDFTGREEDTKKVRAQLDQQGIATIHGMGGIGKTALAVHVAHQLIAEGLFPDAQLYIDLQGAGTSPVDPVDALEGLLNAILDPDPNRPRDLHTLSALWRQAIQGKDALLILDNAAGAAQVRPLLPGCPTCAVLVTSRRRFTLAGAGLLDLRRMGSKDARNLLQELAPRLAAGEADAIAKLCGALPLALRVAGNYLGLNDDVTPEAYGGMLAGERTRLAQLRDPDDPDLDVAAAISLSVDQLDAGPRLAWALLSLFPVPFDLPAAAALWDQPEDQARTRLQSLRNRCLVTYDPDAHRYHQHDLVRLAAASELKAPRPVGEGGWGEGEITTAHLRMARHFKLVADAADDLFTYGGAKAFQGLALFDLELPHIRVGQAWAAAHADHHDEAAQLCSDYGYAAARILALRLHIRDRIAWREPALRAARRLGRSQAESWILSHLGIAYGDLGETHQSIDYYQQALVISKEIGDRRTEAAQLANLGGACADLGQTHKAIDYYEQALEIAKEIGNRRGEGGYLGNLGVAYANLGEIHKAIDYYQQALEINKEIGDRLHEGYQLGHLGGAYADLGQTHKAIDYYQQALEISKELGDQRSEGACLASLGLAYAALGEMHKAIDYYQQALEIAREIDDRRGEGKRLSSLGILHKILGDTARAREDLTQALTIFEAISDPNAERVRQWLANLED